MPGDGLDRFVDAQDRATGDGRTVWQHALTELVQGRKQSHWMWFIFPQIAGLGRSPTAKAFAIGSVAEAGEYLEHPILGGRLTEAATALLEHQGSDAEMILGGIDAIKLRSSMTLFAAAAPDRSLFRELLKKYFGGEPDPLTVEILGRNAG
jgi:uncharacterized protein (DUF1810 family)